MSMKPIKVLFIESPPLAYGSSKSLYSAMLNLDPKKVMPIFACNKHNKICDDAESSGIKTFRLNLPGVPKENKVHRSDSSKFESRDQKTGLLNIVIQLLTLPYRLLRDKIKFSSVINEINKIIDLEKIDIVHLNNQPSSNRFGYYIRKKVLLVQHVRDAPQPYSMHLRYLIKNRKASMISISDFVKVSVESAFDAKSSHKLYNPVDLSLSFSAAKRDIWRKKWEVNPDQVVFGQVGRLINWKGQDLAIKAYAKCCEDSDFKKNSMLVFIGASSDRSEYARKCKEIAKSFPDLNIFFEDYTNDVNGVFSAIDITLHSIRKPEAFGRVIVESMACKSVPLATCTGAIPELIDDGVTGFMHDNQGSFVRQMKKIFQDKEMLNAMKENCFLHAKKFDSKKHSMSLERIYEQVI